MKILKANCDQIAYLESLIKAQDGVYLSARGDNQKLWQVQREFKPVVVIREYEVPTRKGWPVTVKFEFNDLEDRASMHMSRRGLNRLREILPERFGETTYEDGEEELEDNRALQATEPEEA